MQLRALLYKKGARMSLKTSGPYGDASCVALARRSPAEAQSAKAGEGGLVDDEGRNL
jgi:hypothetical protein